MAITSVTETFMTPGAGVWTCPHNFSGNLVIAVVGGGAGGAAGAIGGLNGGGGGGGAVTITADPPFKPIPGSNYPYQVGAGGLGVINGDGLSGTNTFFFLGDPGESSVVGDKGTPGTMLAAGVGGDGSNPSAGPTYTGGNGAYIGSGTTGNGGGSGAGYLGNGNNAIGATGGVAPTPPGTGTGGNGGTIGVNGSNGATPGAGGGGAGTGAGLKGGNGANGIIILTYNVNSNKVRSNQNLAIGTYLMIGL